MSGNPKTIRVAYFTKGVETHHYMEPWEKSPFYCPACSHATVWRRTDGGDYYAGELFLCTRQECGARFYLPNGAEPGPRNEQDLQRLSALRSPATLQSPPPPDSPLPESDPR